MENINVRVAGSVPVRLNTKMLDLMEDPGLKEEITMEAVRMAVAESLGGFSGFVISKEDNNYRAKVNFERFGSCVSSITQRSESMEAQIQSAHDAVCEARQAIRDGNVDTASIEEMLNSLQKLLTLEIPTRSAEEEVADNAKTREANGDSDSTADADETPENAGYTRLVDDDDES